MTVGVFDPDPRTRFVTLPSVTAHASIDALEGALSRGEHSVAIVALEALGSDAPGRLQALRRAAPGARIILVHEGAAGRTRFAHRLWLTGDCDAVVASGDSARLTEAVARFEVEARQTAFEQRGAPAGRDAGRFRMARALFAALSGQDALEVILREFSRGMRQLVDYEVLVLILREPNARPRLFPFQARPAAHQVLFDLADRCCAAMADLAGEKRLSADELEYGQPVLLHGQARGEALREARPEQIACSPLVAGPRVIGCVGAVVSEAAAWSAELLQWFDLAGAHLSISLEHARILGDAQRLSVTDPLTGTHNRRFLDKIMPGEWSRVRRYSLQLTVAVIDIDHFSQINELRGRSVGDAVLVDLGGALRSEVRALDHVVRWGSDQFLVVLPETGSAGAERLIERVRLSLKTTPIESAEGKLHVSISAGVASHPAMNVASPQELIGLAEDALVRAKASAGNRTVHAGAPPSPEGSSPGIDQRREARMDLELPVTFVPLPDVDARGTLRLASVNISARGLAVRDRARLLKRNSYGLAFFDDRPHPLLCKVAWSRAIEGEYHAGLTLLQSEDFHDSVTPRRWESRRALVITENAGYAAIAKRVLRTTKHAVQIWDENSSSTLTDAALAECSLVIIGDRLLDSDAGRRMFEARRSAKGDFRIILLNEDLDRDRAIELISERQVEHLISSRAHPAESLFATLTKMLRQEFFGVHRYLLAGADTKTWTVTRPSDKGYVLSGVRQVAEEVDCHPRIADLLISAVDEMLLNAIYGRKSAAAGLPVTVECGADGRLLCVGVLDDHGVLEVDQIYDSLQAASRARSEGITETAESAHLGFRIMLGALSQLAINVEPGRRTELIGIIDLRKSLREHRTAAPSLGIFKKK
jgi:diguanylate cyclase (GGDEF)-like protein